MSGASFTPQHHNTQRRARPPKALIALDASVPFLQHTAQGAAAESCHTAFAKHSLAAVRGVGRDLRKPPNRCRPPGYKRQQYSAGESGAAERLRPLSTHNLPSIASRPPKFVGLLSPNIGDRTTRGENGAAERLYPLPTHGLSPPSIDSRPPKSAGLLLPDICGSTTRGERRSRTSVPTTACRI